MTLPREQKRLAWRCLGQDLTGPRALYHGLKLLRRSLLWWGSLSVLLLMVQATGFLLQVAAMPAAPTACALPLILAARHTIQLWQLSSAGRLAGMLALWLSVKQTLGDYGLQLRAVMDSARHPFDPRR
ncbi:hypothetical protein [Cedecea sp. NFIX57]|uniref:hypothetical protein n=1 Tax=Cedecea sp. NFIX57 TaxID=1566286 RepID=UPI000A0A0F5F|nr:hypothetical protein [Cedecea sp. NFIX57]SMG60324.1 hypothetical protein SAMN03159353_103532 [Cedecea sp. NFIX57]